MLQIILNVPFFVWPLFALLLVGGLRARKANEVPLAILLLLPLIFFGWSLFSFFDKYANHYAAVFLWLVFLVMGFLIGFFHMQTIPLKFEKQTRKVLMPGSWIPLMLSMSIFTSKLSLGMMCSLFPDLHESFLFLGLELFAITILGIFAGRGINCLFRYRAMLFEAR